MAAKSWDETENCEFEHFYPPVLVDGSPHVSDEEWVDPPGYEESKDEIEPDGTLFVNINKDRLQHSIDFWCSCKSCIIMETERVCLLLRILYYQ